MGAQEKQIGLFSDLHNDVEVLREVLKLEPDVDQWWSVGDVVDAYRDHWEKCNETLDLMISKGIQVIRGNHEETYMSVGPNLDQIKVTEGYEYLYTHDESVMLKWCGINLALNHYPLVGDETSKKSIRDTDLYFCGHSHHHEFQVHANGLKEVNLGHLGRKTFGEPFLTYVVLQADGRVRVMRRRLEDKEWRKTFL